MRSLREKILRQWIADREIQDLTLEEVHAVLDAIALVMYADFEVGAAEAEEFTSLLLALPWGTASRVDRDAYVKEAVSKAAEADEDHELEAYAASVAERLHEGVYEKVFSMLVTMTVADREVAPDEEAVLEAFAEAFELELGRTEVIYHATLRHLGLEDESGGA